MIFKFQEGDQVVLNREYADDLPIGSTGTIFCAYMTNPPAYEVNFLATDGKEFGAIADEADLSAVTQIPLAPQSRQAQVV